MIDAAPQFVPMSVLRELIGAGLAGPALIEACARVAADLAPLLGGLTRPMSGADRMRLMRARRTAAAGVAAGDDVRLRRDGDVTGCDDIVTREADILAASAGPDGSGGGLAQAADSRLIVARKALTVSGLSGHAVAVGAAILEHFNRSSNRCDPGLNTLAARVKRTVRHVRRGVAELRAAGLFAVRRHGGRHHANAYEPQWARMRELVAAWESGGAGVRPVMQVTLRHAEADISAEADRMRPQTQKKIHNSTPGVRSDGREFGQRSRREPDRRQASLMLPIVGGRVLAQQQAATRLAMAFTQHASRFGARAAERMRADIGAEAWARAEAAEIHQRGSGLAVLLEALAPVPFAVPVAAAGSG